MTDVKGSTAFWIAPEGEIILVGSSHIAAVIALPEKFGYTRRQVEEAFHRHGEPLGLEGKARTELIKDLVGKGWIRIRFYPKTQWSINVAALDERVRGLLSAWGTQLLGDAPVTEKVGPYAPVRISVQKGPPVNTTLQGLANTGGASAGTEGQEDCRKRNVMPEQRTLKEAFVHWLQRNRHRFPVEPSVTIMRENEFVIGFPEMAPQIEVLGLASKGGYTEILASVQYRDKCWDLVADFEAKIRRLSSRRYYCDICLPEARRVFRSRGDLLADHLFEPLLRWAEKNLTGSRWACLFGRGSTWAEMVDEPDLERKRGEESFVDAFPVMRR